MKPFLALVAGFVLTLAIFGSGLGFATWILAAKPVQQFTPGAGVADLWSRDARPVNKAAQTYERVTAQQPAVSDPNPPLGAPVDTSPAASDHIVTAAIQPALAQRPPAAHVDWCEGRYRSYRADDNSYMSYSGERRSCISDYLDRGAHSQPLAETVSYVESTSGNGAGYSTEHQQHCFSRYRSYRAEDNTYQPFSGGPRRQCE
jgi:hypothetical protein